jgi:hypothetical protein
MECDDCFRFKAQRRPYGAKVRVSIVLYHVDKLSSQSRWHIYLGQNHFSKAVGVNNNRLPAV